LRICFYVHSSWIATVVIASASDQIVLADNVKIQNSRLMLILATSKYE